MEDESADDFSRLGEIGTTSETMDAQSIFWRIVVNLHFSPSEVDKWTLDEMRIASDYMSMQNDYMEAFSTLMDMERSG